MKDNYIDLRKIDNFTHEIFQLDKIKLVGLKFKKARSEGRLYAFVSTGEDCYKHYIYEKFGRMFVAFFHKLF